MTKESADKGNLLLTGAGIIYICYIAYLTAANHLYAVGFLLFPLILLVIFFPLPLFLLFVASFPFNVIPLIEEVGFSVPRAIGYILFLSWALYIFRERRADLLRIDRISLYFLLFIAWGLITVFWSLRPLGSLLVGFTLLQLWVFYFISMSLIDDKRKLNLVIYAILISYTFVAFNSIIMSLGQLRAVGVKGSDENEFAALMILPIYLSLGLAVYHRKILLRLLFGAVLIILMLGAAATVSRGFLVAILLSFLYRIFLDVNKKRALAAILLVLGLTGPYLLIRYTKRAEVEPPIYVKELPMGRRAIWIVGMEIIKESPILGVGMGSFRVAFDKEYQENRYKTGFVGYGRVAHNDFISIFAEYGIIGLLIWLGMIVYILRESYRLNFYFQKAGDEYLYAIANAIACALLAILLCQAFLGLYLSKFFWLIIAFVPILKTIARRQYGLQDDLMR
jgi:O-antigen ligase